MHALSEQNYIQQLSIDCVILGYRKGQLNVLMPKLNFQGDFFTLPSGFVYQYEDIDAAARRILLDRTGLNNVYLEQFHVFGQADRNNRVFMDRLLALNPQIDHLEQQHRREYDWITQRFVSIGYYALVDINQVVPRKNEIDQSIEWYSLKALPPLVMDNGQIIHRAIQTLRLTLDDRFSVFHLLPDTFTMREVQEVYEAIYDKPFARNNFSKKILDMNVLERLEKKFTGAANKAPYLYRLQKERLVDISQVV